MEEGRDYKLELCSNIAGRFLLCSVFSMEEKRLTLVFLEHRRIPRGWMILAKKLRILGGGPLQKTGQVAQVDSLQMWENGEGSLSIGISYVEMMGSS